MARQGGYIILDLALSRVERECIYQSIERAGSPVQVVNLTIDGEIYNEFMAQAVLEEDGYHLDYLIKDFCITVILSSNGEFTVKKQSIQEKYNIEIPEGLPYTILQNGTPFTIEEYQEITNSKDRLFLILTSDNKLIIPDYKDRGIVKTTYGTEYTTSFFKNFNPRWRYNGKGNIFEYFYLVSGSIPNNWSINYSNLAIGYFNPKYSSSSIVGYTFIASKVDSLSPLNFGASYKSDCYINWDIASAYLTQKSGVEITMPTEIGETTTSSLVLTGYEYYYIKYIKTITIDSIIYYRIFDCYFETPDGKRYKFYYDSSKHLTITRIL